MLQSFLKLYFRAYQAIKCLVTASSKCSAVKDHLIMEPTRWQVCVVSCIDFLQMFDVHRYFMVFLKFSGSGSSSRQIPTPAPTPTPTLTPTLTPTPTPYPYPYP